jgi:acetyltransferase-like isoleucine patch superfamily enzyme
VPHAADTSKADGNWEWHVMGIALKIKRAETPFYAGLKRLAVSIIHFDLPFWRPWGLFLRAIYVLTKSIIQVFRRFIAVMYYGPIFKSYCVSCGRNLYLELVPSISGPVQIFVGDHVYISGALGIASGHVFDEPELRIGDRVFLGHRVSLVLSRQIIVEDGVMLAQGCYITDSNAHPVDPELRSQGLPPAASEIKSVRICRNAWIGRGAYILKGVTVGEGAIVGAGAVVTKDVPPMSIAVGNPARILERERT